MMTKLEELKLALVKAEDARDKAGEAFDDAEEARWEAGMAYDHEFCRLKNLGRLSKED
jgi:hypothetical protein